MANRLWDNYETEKALLKIAEGDGSGFNVLYDKLGRKIFSLAFSILSDRATAEDAMQETFMKILRCAGSYRKGGGGAAWVMAIARNTALDMARKRRYTEPEEALDSVAAESDFTEALAVNELLRELDDVDRDIVILKAANGFRFREIAKIVGLSPDAAEKRYRRALEKLRPKFE